MKNKLKVEVWSDIVCPFCYIGKRNYESALAAFEHKDKVELEFKSYQLDANFVQDTTQKHDYRQGLAHKYGRSLEEINTMIEQMTSSAKAVGLDFDLDNAVQFNTFDAHRILHLAKEKGLGNQLKEALLAAYFIESKDLGNKEVLKAEALKIGLNATDFDKVLTDDSYAYTVKQDIQEAGNLQISGVPFYVFDRKYGVSGAQPPAVFLDTLRKTYAEWTGKSSITLENTNEGMSCDTDGNCD
ncbi:MAG TPA: DsbA family oxidoreductase [Flavobacterium sp.]|nr:DsbA family oxidoreductase [Flavobacterium sp.]